MKRLRWRRTPRNLDRLRSLTALETLYLEGCPPGRGRAPARIVWLCLASHLRWGRSSGRVHVNDQTIARETGLAMRAVERGIAYLVRVGKLARSYGVRGRGRARRYGRVLNMQIDGPAPIVELPSEAEVAEIWKRVRRLSSRPVTALGIALAAHVVVKTQHRKLGRVRKIDASVGELARLLGIKRGGSFNAHLQLLADVGVLGKPGDRWRGFIVFGRLAETFDELRGRLLRDFAPGLMKVRQVAQDAEDRLAEMAAAFAAQYAAAG